MSASEQAQAAAGQAEAKEVSLDDIIDNFAPGAEAPWVVRGKRRGWDSNPRGTCWPLPAFKAGAFDRSATPPGASRLCPIAPRSSRTAT